MQRNEKLTLCILAAVAFSTIFYGSTFGIHGLDTWRIADAYGHILGFMQFKDFQNFDLFGVGRKQVFDIPVYPFIIAKLSTISHIHPFTIAALFNCLCLLSIAFNGYKFCEFAGKNQAGIVFCCLLLTSPMYLHFASMPLPDMLAIALSFYAISCLMRKELCFRSSILPVSAIALAALIKSPVPLFFLLFQFYCLIIDKTYRNRYLDSAEKFSVLFTLYFVALCFAVGAEVLRTYLVDGRQYGLVDGVQWYFGTLDLRLSWEFWLLFIIHICVFSMPPFLLLFLVNLIYARNKSADLSHMRYAYAAFLSYLTVYLIFAQLLDRHLYYSLPGALLFYVSFAISFSRHYSARQEKKQAGIAHEKLYVALLGVAAILVMLTNVVDRHAEFEDLRVVRAALANESVFLHVSDIPEADPSLGGLLETKYIRVTQEEFEKECKRYMEKYVAIFLDNESLCLNENIASVAIKTEKMIKTSKGILVLQAADK